MISMTLSEAARILDLRTDDEVEFAGVCSDSRAVRKGFLFAALQGDRVDGHDYIPQAVEAGAVAVLASRETAAGVPILVVDDVINALGLLAHAWRMKHNPRVIAVTGSNGKTTTKEMVASILGKSARVLATAGNYNNELGLPLTLFSLEESHRFAVLELGASKAGDIRYLAGIAKPDVGVVTNVGPAHLQGFGDEEGVARAKGELYSSLPTEGFAVINADQPWAGLWRGLSRAGSEITYGSSPECDVYPELRDGHLRVHTPAGEFNVRLHLPGAHNVENALAATAVACSLGVPPEQIRKGLEATMPLPGRLHMIHPRAGWTVIDDTYNANPASLYAALQVLSAEQGEPWLVLGDMLELGPVSRKMHVEMGDAAQSLGVKRLYAIGEVTVATVDAFGSGARHFKDHASLIDALHNELHPGVVCLVKGSRSMGMERVVDAISGAAELREAG